ncbi:hypothetical protein C8Q75DRAFT_738432 [Abortiporus biennis]|nr:hypothetical protein C8Q75DRAFT_738432 [Abortiporus biennis]
MLTWTIAKPSTYLLVLSAFSRQVLTGSYAYVLVCAFNSEIGVRIYLFFFFSSYPCASQVSTFPKYDGGRMNSHSNPLTT